MRAQLLKKRPSPVRRTAGSKPRKPSIPTSNTGYSILRGTPVLLVEDDPVNRMVAVGLLEAVGMEIDAAGNGAEAMEMVGKKNSKSS